MTDKTKEALKLALEALEEIHPGNMTPIAEEAWNKAITAIREALDEQPAIKQDLTPEQPAPVAEPRKPQQEPVAWINWCAATGKRSVSFACESELASQPLYEGITQNTQYHYSKFHSWFDSELHRQKYTKDHPAYLAAQEAWNAANDAAQHRINRLNAEIEAWKVRFKIAEDALAKLNGPEQKPVAYGLFVNGELSWDSEWAFSNESFPVQFDDEECRPLYTSPQYEATPLASQRSVKPWVGLTDEEVMSIAFNFDVPSLVVRTVEAKLKEKND